MFFPVCVFSECSQLPVFSFSSFLGDPGGGPGGAFLSLGAVFQRRLAPSILNDSTVFWKYFQGFKELKNGENQIKRY